MSLWNKDKKNYERQGLNENISVDILIIGAGITGLTTAYYLKNYPSICVVDASSFGHGVTLNTTAKITYLQGRIYTKIGDSKSAKTYLQSQLDSMNNLIEIINKENIKCDLEKVPSYVFANTKKEINLLKKEVKFLKQNGIDIIKKQLPLKIKSYASFCVNDTYTFHPLKYLRGIYNILKEKQIPIYENSKILKIEKNKNGYICYGKNFNIKTNKVIVASHYPYFILPFVMPIKSYLEKSYIIISKVENIPNFSCISSSNPTYSCRFYEDDENKYQISLSESHDISMKQNDKYHFNRVKQIFGLKDENIIMKYSNVDIMTPDHIPYIGQIKENMFLTTGYNTWGMTNSVLAANIISNLVLNKKNKYNNIFDPKRIKFTNYIKDIYYIITQIKSYVGSKIIKNKNWYSNNVFVKNGIGIYVDKFGKEHRVYNKCPHLGCGLIFNEEEKTWDCPCHSSRFDIDGKCIKGPSNYDISYKED